MSPLPLLPVHSSLHSVSYPVVHRRNQNWSRFKDQDPTEMTSILAQALVTVFRASEKIHFHVDSTALARIHLEAVMSVSHILYFGQPLPTHDLGRACRIDCFQASHVGQTHIIAAAISASVDVCTTITCLEPCSSTQQWLPVQRMSLCVISATAMTSLSKSLRKVEAITAATLVAIVQDLAQQVRKTL